ncbi:MAG: Xaa-Pro peptidase family protein [Henriciella sp.]|jgi:Xaa-Pro dipeptidase
MPVSLPSRITAEERQQRVSKLCNLMAESGTDAVLLSASTNLRYFTGINWHPSERFLGAIVHADGSIDYVAPHFELDKVSSLISLPGDVLTWQEEQNPYAMIARRMGTTGRLALDDQLPMFMYRKLRAELDEDRLPDGGPLTTVLRSRKSVAEIALMSRAKEITLEVHKRAHAYLKEGMLASEVTAFIDAQHRELAGAKSTFCITSFAEDTSLPHGGESDRALKSGDVVLIDTGTQIDGYNSDITRTYVFGEPSDIVRQVWETEKAAQAAAFDAAKLGVPCKSVDAAARAVVEQAGYGPDYRLPGVPHRTGHGIGLDIHEAPNLVRGDDTALDIGMCFSNEPMIVVPGEFGIRLEDHFHMTAEGPKWFTQPQASLDAPFEGVAPLTE